MSAFTGERAVRAHSFFIDLPVADVCTFTGLGEEGNAFVRGMDEARYAGMIGGWESAIREFADRVPRG